jgi:opine dehydrogenase
MSAGEPCFAVIGAGHGGKAMAADLASRGFRVHLFNRTPARIHAIRLRGGIVLEDEKGDTRFGPIPVVTTDMGEALDGADVVMVVVPASAHRDVARLCASHLRDGQVVVLNPGRTGGALEFRQVLEQEGCTARALVAEAQTLICSSRSTDLAEAKIFRLKSLVLVAALPATETPKVLEALHPAYPQFAPAENVLYTSLDNMGAVLHPALTILNAGRIEGTKGAFQFYVEGTTPSIARVLEAVDRERLAVAEALGVRAFSALEWLQTAYAATGRDLGEAIQNNPTYRGVGAPRTLTHRYIFEDVPTSLVPIADLGRHFGAPTPVMEALITLASALHGTDYWATGRTLERLGLKGWTKDQLLRYVNGGER